MALWFSSCTQHPQSVEKGLAWILQQLWGHATHNLSSKNNSFHFPQSLKVDETIWVLQILGTVSFFSVLTPPQKSMWKLFHTHN